MKKGAIALRVLPGLLLGVCATASAAEPGNVLRRTPFVLGEASSKAAPEVLPATEAQAVAEQRVLPGGIIAMELPADRLLELVAVPRADGTMEVMHRDHGAPMPVAKQEVKE